MMEQWENIKDWNGYQVSSEGRVRSVDRIIYYDRPDCDNCKRVFKGIIRKQRLSNCGYPRINLCINGVTKMYAVHRLVAMAFISNPENKPMVNHIDANKENNYYKNLEWCTRRENQDHSNRLGLQVFIKGENIHTSKLKESDVVVIKQLLSAGVQGATIAKEYNVTGFCIYSIKNGRNWKHVK